MSGVLCFLEHDEESVLDASLRALTFARSLATTPDHVLMAALVGEVSPNKTETLSLFGVNVAYQIEIDDLETYSPSGWARAVAELAESLGADVVVAAGTDRGQEILAHFGASRGLAMAANCLTATWANAESIQLSRQRWAGSLIEHAVLDGVPALLTVASDGVLAAPAEVSASTSLHVHHTSASELDSRVAVREWIRRSGGIALADARVVVGGGRGVGSEAGFGALDDLASLLGAAVGVSRVVTSNGWRPHAQQVGQTGTKISPDLYLACGISGATQHLAGCRSAKHVVAINIDADAPFLSRADYALVGDLSVIVPALADAIRSRTRP
ncbi:MAG: electron transfer flavoprotein subunit alpha/FixB family protein [Acidimicrobiales bacterium]